MYFFYPRRRRELAERYSPLAPKLKRTPEKFVWELLLDYNTSHHDDTFPPSIPEQVGLTDNRHTAATGGRP